MNIRLKNYLKECVITIIVLFAGGIIISLIGSGWSSLNWHGWISYGSVDETRCTTINKLPSNTLKKYFESFTCDESSQKCLHVNWNGFSCEEFVSDWTSAINSPMSSSSDVPTSLNDSNFYQGYVTQIGGIWSRNVEKTVYQGLYGNEGQLYPAGNYLIHSFNTPGDLMWVSCREGYEIVRADSPTNNKIVGITTLPDYNHPVLEVGITIENTPKNIIVVQCRKL